MMRKRPAFSLLTKKHMTQKPILDVCCGARMFYFDKENPDVLFCDNREVERRLIDGRTFEVRPDVMADFRQLPFADGSFSMVIFDPPHLRQAGEGSWLAQKYGTLPKDGWRKYLGHGFRECWRVLKPGGVLVFKWNEHQIKISRLKNVFPAEPVFGTRTRFETMFLVFYKPVDL